MYILYIILNWLVDCLENTNIMKNDKKELSFPIDREQELMGIAKSHIASHVISRFKNFFIEQEILQRQGFNGAISRRNLAQIRKNLIAGFDYIKQHATSVDDGFLLEGSLYADLKDSKLGMTREEANLFELITTSLTIQHNSPINIPYGESLKSTRHREIAGEKVEIKRTRNSIGRQNFVYFFTGIGKQINVLGLHGLNTYQIDLNKLALHNPQKFLQLYVSPHLTEFETNACIFPCLMGNTRIDIQFDGKNQTITYRFQRSDNCLLERTYHAHDFVFFGGHDVLTGIVLRFIELLRFVGNPYRQELLARLADPVLSKQEKLQQLSVVMASLMPGSMVIEAKIPQEIQLHDTYTQMTTSEEESNSDLDDNLYLDGDGLHLKTNSIHPPFVEYLKRYAVDFAAYAEISFIDKNEFEEEFAEVIHQILTKFCCNGPYAIGMPSFSGYIPTDLNLFLYKLIYSDHDLSLLLIQWLLTAKFVSPNDNQLHYLLNMNQRESAGTQDLFVALLSTRFKEEKHKKLLEIFFPLLNEKRVQLEFCHYVVIAAFESFNGISTSKEVAFLLEKNIPIDENDSHLLSWVSFEGNEKLLEYMFIKQLLNINAIVHQYSWLEHAILNQNEAAAHWLLDHGAVLRRHHPKVMKVMPESVSRRLGLVTDEAQEDDQLNKRIYRDAVVIIVTATYHNGDVYTIMGRRRVNNKLEEQWSFPGGIIEFGETPVEAAIRELSEETTVAIEEEKASVQEIMRVKFHPQHQNENNIDNLIFVHVNLGKSLLPSAWPSDDLGEVAKVKFYEKRSDQLLQNHKNLPIRVSNALLFDDLKKQELSIHPGEFSLLLFAEMFPCKFMGYYMGLLKNIEEKLSGNDSNDRTYYDEVEPIQHDKSALIELKHNTISLVQQCLQKISHTIHDPEIKESILTLAIDSGDVQFLKFLLEHGYLISDLQEDARCDLVDLLRNHQWEMLHFICEQVPHIFHVEKGDWKKVNGLIPSIPFEEIRNHINSTNADHIIFDKLMYLFKEQTNDLLEQRAPILTAVKDILRKHPEVMKKLTERHIKLILLSGDVELFKSCYQQPQFETLPFNSRYFYDFYGPPSYEMVSISQYLSNNKHTEMLSFLKETFTEAFASQYNNWAKRY